MDEDDPIVDEIPVFLSKNLEQNLCIMQFPVNNIFDINKSNITNCCYKPESKQVKIDFKIETDSRNYDAFKGEMIAKTADGNSKTHGTDKNDLPSFSSGRMDKATFTSTLNDNRQQYAVGVMQDKQLHLVPISNIFQMRQTFAYFDKGDKRTKAEKGDVEMPEEEEEDIKQVTVKFARPASDNERIKRAKERSYQFISSIGQDEPWCEALIYTKDSPQAQIERQKIPYTAANPHQLTPIPTNDYLDTLIGGNTNSLVDVYKTDDTTARMAQGIFSKKQVKKLPLIEQLKIVLKDAKVLTFNNIMEIVGNAHTTPDKVLRNLTLCGLMIRGNWVLQSEFLFLDNFVSSTNGIGYELMRKGRDYVLFKLIRNELMTLNRQKISAITQLPAEETREVLATVASLKSNKTWDLLKPPDYDFEKRHPEILQRQDALWKAQEEKFLEMEAEKTEKRKRTRSIRETK